MVITLISRDFYANHTQPINSVYHRVVVELLVEMHLLSVNVDFKVDPIYCLGVVTSFDRFMQGYKPEKDKESIFAALCRCVGGDDRKYRQEAESVLALAKSMSGAPTPVDSAENVATAISEIANNPKFKYSRLFAIGLYTFLEEADPELVEKQEKRNELLQQLSKSLHLPAEKIQKDLDLYRSNLEKMTQFLKGFDCIVTRSEIFLSIFFALIAITVLVFISNRIILQLIFFPVAVFAIGFLAAILADILANPKKM